MSQKPDIAALRERASDWIVEHRGTLGLSAAVALDAADITAIRSAMLKHVSQGMSAPIVAVSIPSD